MFRPIVAAVAAVLVAGCASKLTKEEERATVGQAPPAGPSIEAKQVAAEAEASEVTEISFAKGKQTLGTEAKRKLSAMIDRARKAGAIDEINVLVWADREFPSVNTQKLSKDQRTLAERRGEEIEKFLNSVDKDAEVNAFSMAERSSALERLFGTEDSRLKKSLEVAGVPNTDTSVKAPAKASKAIVMVRLKE